MEDGSHVRWGYTEEGLRELLAGAGIDVVDQERISGVVAQLLTRWMLRLDEVYPHLGSLLTLPLRLLQPFDRVLPRLVGYRYLCRCGRGGQALTIPAVRVAVVGHLEWVEFVHVDHVPAAGEIVNSPPMASRSPRAAGRSPPCSSPGWPAARCW